MKIVRLGNTESHLMLINYILKNGNESQHIKRELSKLFSNFMMWAYKTGGYYDKNLKCQISELNLSGITPKFMKFVNDLYESMGNCHETQYYLSDGIIPLFDKYKHEMSKKYNVTQLKSMNGSHIYDRIESIFDFIKNKKVLVISSFDGLIEQQYKSGNLNKIHPYTFPNITDLKSIKFPYCFSNTGPDQDFHETLNKCFEKIKNIDFDIALLGCGCYGHKLCHLIDSELNKDAIYLGGSIQSFFGILSQREKNFCSRTGKRSSDNFNYNEYWITDIPIEYRPSNYKDVEDGCYW